MKTIFRFARMFSVRGLLLAGLFAALLFLGWSGWRVVTLFFFDSELIVESLPDMRLPLGQDLALTLRGKGFSPDTRVSLVADLTSDDAAVATLPFVSPPSQSLIVGSKLYLGGGTSDLSVVNIERPEAPRLLETYLPGRTPVSLFYADGRLYVSWKRFGISILTIGDDGLLTHEADILTSSPVSSVVYLDGYLYAAAGKDGIRVYETLPSEQATLQTPFEEKSFVSDLCVYRQILFALSPRLKEIGVYSLKDPSAPERCSQIKLKDRIYDIAVMQQQLFVATAGGLYVFQIDDEGDLHFSRQLDFGGPVVRLYPGNGELYVVDSFTGVSIVDPITGEAGETYQFSNVCSVAGAGGYLYLTGAQKGLSVVSLDKIEPKGRVHLLSVRATIRDLIEYAGHLFVAGYSAGVQVGVRASLVTDPVFLSIATTASYGLAIVGQYLFVAQKDAGIEVIDISDVDHPVSVAQWPDLPASHISVFGSYLVVSASNDVRVSLVDISDLQHPQVVDRRTDIQVVDMVVSGEYLLVSSKTEGLVVFELSRQELSRVGCLSTPFPMSCFDLAGVIAVRGGAAYIANGRSGLLVVDIENPKEMEVLAAIPLSGFCKGLYIHGGRLYAVSHNVGMSVFDLEDPTSPRMLGFLDLTGLSSTVLSTAGTLYLPRTNGGLLAVPEIAVPREMERVSAERLEVVFPAPDVPGTFAVQLNNANGSVELDTVIEFYAPDNSSLEPGVGDAQNL
jgi:hypothetical protein